MKDVFKVYQETLPSRLWMGTARFPSPFVLEQAIERGNAGLITVSLRREAARGSGAGEFLKLLSRMNTPLLPNTAGCRTVKEAITTAHMARELLGTPRLKLEIVTDDVTLCPDMVAVGEASRILVEEGFEVYPYMTEDLSMAGRLLAMGVQVLMPWGSPIGSCRGLNNPYGLKMLRQHFPEAVIVVDAGLGLPSQAAAAMEMGMDAVLLNTAIADAVDPALMAAAFSQAIEAGRQGFLAGPPAQRDTAFSASSLAGRAFISEG